MSISGQFVSLLAMIGSGIIAGAFMDMIGTAVAQTGKTSKVRRFSGWLEGAGWLLAGGFAFAVLFHFRSGEWRMYDPFAQFAGLLVYASLFCKPFRFAGRLIVLLVIRPVLWVIRLLFGGIRLIGRILLAIVNVLFAPFRYGYRRLVNFRFKKKPV